MSQKIQRRLSAVVSADVVGYSRLMGVDAAGTLKCLNEHRSELIDVKVAEQDGRIVKTMGDGLLIEFLSAVNAIQFSFEVQQGMSERHEGKEVGQRIQLRIGVNLGDLIIEGDDIFGDGVNIAARLQEIAEPGGVCISGAVFEQISGATDYKFDDLGYRKLKNITQPVHVHQVRFSDSYSDGESRTGFPHLIGAEKRQPAASGGCLCGCVRFETWNEPIGVGYCHCRFCQLAVGAPLNAWAVYEEKFVSYLGDAPKMYRSSLVAERAFCGNCGTSLYTYFEAASDKSRYYAIRLATLDNPQDFPPGSHFAVESQLPWLDINDDLPRICTGDDAELSARWTAVGQPKSGPKLGSAIERLQSASED